MVIVFVIIKLLSKAKRKYFDLDRSRKLSKKNRRSKKPNYIARDFTYYQIPISIRVVILHEILLYNIQFAICILKFSD